MLLVLTLISLYRIPFLSGGKDGLEAQKITSNSTDQRSENHLHMSIFRTQQPAEDVGEDVVEGAGGAGDVAAVI